MNVLLEKPNLKYGAINFKEIKPENFLPAITEAIAGALEKYKILKKISSPTFHNFIKEMEVASESVDYISEIFFALYNADSTDEISKLATEFSEKLTKFANDITLDADIFEQIKKVYKIKNEQDLSVEERQVLEDTYVNFKRNGALLNDEQKNSLRTIDESLSKLSLEFSENVRNATNSYELIIDNKDDLQGMPDSVIEQASELAKTKGQTDKWIFTLEYTSFLPFMKYCQKRELRKKMNEAAGQKAAMGEWDNKSRIKDILALRNERANLLGYATHAHFVLEKRMAQNPDTVMSFLNKILIKAKPAADKELKRLKNLKKELTNDEDFQKYDAAFYSEILKKRELNIDDELLRPYFKLENVIDGVFNIAGRLYDLDFVENHDIPKYHADVRIYEVKDKKGDFIGLFYADFFPRESKRPGAWMTNLKAQGLMFGQVARPLVSIVCNFTKPTKTKPSLLTLDEVLTMFHEFGHALHGLLSKCTYRSVSGTNVYWDFVELPSQIMENWVLEEDSLKLFAKHYETGELIPTEYIHKILESRKFLEGLGTLRQLGLGYLDMAWHVCNPKDITDIVKFENDLMKDYDPYPRDGKQNMSCSFSHIFAGGYAAGYYSYKWAEVLDADAFEYFKTKGIFDKNIAQKFKENILEKGGSEHPMDLYKKFRGQEPDVAALLKRSGLI